MSTKLIIGALIVVSLVSGFYIWRFQSTRGIDVDFEIPESTTSGEPFDMKVSVSNSAGSVLEDVRLMVVLPEGAAFFGSSNDKTVETRSLGNVGEGGLLQEEFRVIMFSPEESAQDIKVTLSYAPSSLGARFEKSEKTSITVKAAGVAVEMNAPESVVSGEEFEMTVSYRNISESDFIDLELRLEYPPSFSFSRTSREPDSGNNVWLLGDLRKNSESSFTIHGALTGTEGEVFAIKSFLNTRSGRNQYLVTESMKEVIVSSSPLALTIHLNDDALAVVKIGDTLHYIVSYVNTTEAALDNITIRAQLKGELFDMQTLKTKGSFRASDNTLVWDQSNTPELSRRDAGSAGVVDFTINVKNEYSIRRFSDKDFMLRVFVEANAPTVPSALSLMRIFSKAQHEVKTQGAIAVDAKGYFRDAASGILNTGPLPPRVNQKTQFTIHWLVKGSAADFSEVEVRSILGDTVKMIGQAHSTSGSLPTYDDGRNEVVWRIGRLQANQGVISDPVEAVFQIEVTPEQGDAGTYFQLVGPTSIRAIDDFTGLEVGNTDMPITTALPDDATIGSQGGVVQP
ncbi:MAG: hypothetical protein Q8R26_02280 [bacterium]|nr:hypothetical protein [bacterium]